MAFPDDHATVDDWLHWTAEHFDAAGLFFGHGCDNAYDEAAWLILHALQLPVDRLDDYADRKLSPQERGEVLDLVEQRVAKKIPTAYLTHEAWQSGHRFYVDERVIVPRSYFAELLEDGLSPWIADDMCVDHALDLCTGSGCLAILTALAFTEAKVDAVDLSSSALDVARRNVDDYALQDRVTLFESDLFAALMGRRYDLIISNPPYVTTAAMRELPQEYRHEPSLALAAGEDGLDIVRRIFLNAAEHLTPNGVLMVEVGHNADLVEDAFPRVSFTWIDTPSSEGKIFLLSRQELAAYFA